MVSENRRKLAKTFLAWILMMTPHYLNQLSYIEIKSTVDQTFRILKPLAFWKLNLLFKHLKWLKSRIIYLVQRFRLESSVSNSRIRVITNKIQTKIRQRIKYKWFVDVCFTNTPNNNILHWKVLRLLCSCKRLITFWKPLKT